MIVRVPVESLEEVVRLGMLRCLIKTLEDVSVAGGELGDTVRLLARVPLPKEPLDSAPSSLT